MQPIEDETVWFFRQLNTHLVVHDKVKHQTERHDLKTLVLSNYLWVEQVPISEYDPT